MWCLQSPCKRHVLLIIYTQRLVASPKWPKTSTKRGLATNLEMWARWVTESCLWMVLNSSVFNVQTYIHKYRFFKCMSNYINLIICSSFPDIVFQIIHHYSYLTHYLGFSVIALHDCGAICVIHNNPHFHSGKRQPYSPCYKTKQKHTTYAWVQCENSCLKRVTGANPAGRFGDTVKMARPSACGAYLATVSPE